MTIAYSSGAMGAVSAVGTAAIQAAGSGDTTMASLLVPVVSAAIGAAMSYAVLKTTVEINTRDISAFRQDMNDIYTLLRDANNRIAHIEGRLNRPE